MAFLEETARLLGIDKQTSTAPYLYVSPEVGLVVEGYVRIRELSGEKILLSCAGKKSIEICGEGLSVKEISHREMCVEGKISSISFKEQS